MISYRVEYDDEVIMTEFETPALAREWADNWWQEKNADLPNGHTATTRIMIVGVEEKLLVGEVDEPFSYQEHQVTADGYHGDVAEHGWRAL